MKSSTEPKTNGHTCPWWFIFTFDNPIRKLIHKPERILGRYVKSGDVVLDVGCGIGFFTIGLARLVGVDGRVIAADQNIRCWLACEKGLNGQALQNGSSCARARARK